MEPQMNTDEHRYEGQLMNWRDVWNGFVLVAITLGLVLGCDRAKSKNSGASTAAEEKEMMAKLVGIYHARSVDNPPPPGWRTPVTTMLSQDGTFEIVILNPELDCKEIPAAGEATLRLEGTWRTGDDDGSWAVFCDVAKANGRSVRHRFTAHPADGVAKLDLLVFGPQLQNVYRVAEIPKGSAPAPRDKEQGP